MVKTNFNKKPHFPYTYGESIKNDDKRPSNRVVNLVQNERFQNYCVLVVNAFITLSFYAKPASAIPVEYGEHANNIINNVDRTVPPLNNPVGLSDFGAPGMNVGQENPQLILPAMPLEQQHRIAAQQAGKLGPMPGVETGPTSPPSFYIPGKPTTVARRAINTTAFATAMGIICMNAVWGEPVAVIMCSSGLMTLAYKLGKEVVLFMTKNMK